MRFNRRLIIFSAFFLEPRDLGLQKSVAVDDGGDLHTEGGQRILHGAGTSLLFVSLDDVMNLGFLGIGDHRESPDLADR